MGGGGGLGSSLGSVLGGAAAFGLGPLGVAAGAAVGGQLGGALDNGLGGQSAANPFLQNPATANMATDQYNNANSLLQQQTAFANAAAAQNGLANQNQAYQMALQQAQGLGPNPAQAQLAQATSANTANQAALMAGQRGTGANAGLLARQAAMQGGANQQQAAGQAATLGAQQQLSGQQLAANIAAQQVNNQANALGNAQGAAQGLYGQVSNNLTNQNNAALGLAGQQNQVIGNNIARTDKIIGGLINGGASALAMANGGMVPPSGPRSQLHAALNFKAGGDVPGQAAVAGNSLKNDVVPAMLSPGELVVDRETLADGGEAGKAARFLQAYLSKRKPK